MVFPQTPLPVVVQALFDGIYWTDITAKAYVRQIARITRGQPNEASSPEPSKVEVVLNNRDGRYSPRNPTGPHYGLIGRGTQLRVGIAESAGWLSVPGPIGSTDTFQYVQTTDKAALDITGDLDIRFDADLDSWRDGVELVSKWLETGNQRSYMLFLDDDGHLVFYRSVDGTAGTTTQAVSTVPVPIVRGRIAVRVTLDVDNGAGGRTTAFYTAPSLAGSWTALGSPRIGTPTTSVFAGTAPVFLLNNTGSSVLAKNTRGKVYGAEIRSGIGGTVVASPDFTAATAGASSYTDAQSNIWIVTGTELTNLNVRGHGEVSTWPVEWDDSQNDVWTTVTADGIMRRLGQGAAPLRSSMYRAILDDAFRANVVAYWPCEDLDGSSSIASALPKGRVMASMNRSITVSGLTFSGPDDDTQFATYTDFGGSAPLPTLGDKSAWYGAVPNYSGSGTASMWALLNVPAAGITDDTDLFKVNTTGSLSQTVIRYGTINSGSIQIRCYDNEGSLIIATAWVGLGLNGKNVKISIELSVSGGNTVVTVGVLEPGAGSGFAPSVTATGATFGKITGIAVAARRGAGGVSFGQISVHKTIPNLFDLNAPYNGWRGETAGRRIQRLCTEEDVPFVGFGDLDDTVPLGFQTPSSFLDLVEQAALADGGQLAEARDALAITYCPRAAMEGQPADVSLPYSVMRDLRPVEDDQALTNDVEIVRAQGSSIRVEATTGRLSVSQPPAGAGRYASSQTLSLAYDEQLPGRANLALRIGTVDQARYPVIGLDLEHPSISGNAARTAAARRLDLGDRLTITGPLPLWIAPDDIDQLVLGTTEELGVFEHTLSMNAVPYQPYRAGFYDALAGRDQARYDTLGSYLSGTVTPTATTLVVVTPNGGLPWTVDPTSLPFDVVVGGERMTVTAVTGASSPQTFTVVRSVNGVVKSHLFDTAVSLADVTYYRI